MRAILSVFLAVALFGCEPGVDASAKRCVLTEAEFETELRSCQDKWVSNGGGTTDGLAFCRCATNRMTDIYTCEEPDTLSYTQLYDEVISHCTSKLGWDRHQQ